MIASNIINLNLRLEIQNNNHYFLFQRKFYPSIYFVCVCIERGGESAGGGVYLGQPCRTFYWEPGSGMDLWRV